MKLIVNDKDSIILIEGDINTEDVESLLKDTIQFVKKAITNQRQFFIDASNVQIQDFSFYVWLLSLGKYVINKGGHKINLALNNPPFHNAMSPAFSRYFNMEGPNER